MHEWVKPAKPRWYSGQDLVRKWGIKGFELFDLMKNGLQAYTSTGKKVVDSDSLPRAKKDSLEKIEANQRAKQNARVIDGTGSLGRTWSDYEIKQLAQRIYNNQSLEIINPPKDCELMSFTLPSNDERANEAISKVLCFQFKAVDIVKFKEEYNHSHPLPSEETQNETADPSALSQIERANMAGEPQQMQILPADQAATRPPVKTSAVNFFTRENRDIWRIGFEGQETPINHIDGLLYIGYLLDKHAMRKTSISCRELYQAVSGRTPGKIMSEGAAIGEGFNIGSRKQAASDHEARQSYLKQYQKLSNDLDKVEDNPEGEIVRNEIEKEIAAIMPYLKEKTFVDPNDKKAQVNMKKRLETAYKAIDKAGMNKMAKHLQDHIKPDGAFGLSYTGSFTWDITLKIISPG